MTNPIFLTLEELIERTAAGSGVGALRNWCSMRIGPSFIKIARAVLDPLEELKRWDHRNLAITALSAERSLQHYRITKAVFIWKRSPSY